MIDPASQGLLAAVDREFREGRLELSVPPPRLYLNLTERCSLGCRQCITGAPELTARGAARDMTPEVVAALRPHLAHVSYLGFPHAGEPLIAPMLEPVLEALREERRGAFTVVHLLTNGLALTERRFRELVRLGVNSISVSMDGMSARTHDALRVGSRIEQLKPRLEGLARLRSAEDLDVRLGIAWTVTRSNLDEVPLLLQWASETSIDWVKLEEVFPNNLVAHAEGALEPSRLGSEVQRALAEADRLGLRLLEHVFDKECWGCQPPPDPSTVRFSQLDSYANRMDILPCRLPWELACVEPDGALKPVSFDHPAAGSIVHEDLRRLWNFGPFLEARAASKSRRLCRASGNATCPPDPGPVAW